MNTTGKFVLGSVVGLLGILGLFVAAAAHEGALYGAGLLVFVGCVLFIMFLINRAFHGGDHSS